MFDSKVNKILSKTLEILSSEDNWTIGAFARSNLHSFRMDDIVPPWDSRAKSWNAKGAIERAAYDCGEYMAYLKAIYSCEKFVNLDNVNYNNFISLLRDLLQFQR